jgi:hypothetical protein
MIDISNPFSLRALPIVSPPATRKYIRGSQYACPNIDVTGLPRHYRTIGFQAKLLLRPWHFTLSPTNHSRKISGPVSIEFVSHFEVELLTRFASIEVNWTRSGRRVVGIDETIDVLQKSGTDPLSLRRRLHGQRGQNPRSSSSKMTRKRSMGNQFWVAQRKASQQVWCDQDVDSPVIKVGVEDFPPVLVTAFPKA